MTITLEEINLREAGLRQEIAERERLLQAYQTLREDVARLFGNVARSAPQLAHVFALPQATLPPTALPAPAAPPKRYVNPELQAIGQHFGRTGRIVAWAIRKMTADYTITDLGQLLIREGGYVPSAQISVVLTRLKARGEIEQLECGGGRKPALFRKPTPTGEPIDDTASSAEPPVAEGC